MTISFPRTDIMSFCGYAPDAVPLRLTSRQESSRTAGGVTVAKDLGPALWFGSYVTTELDLDDMVSFEATLNSLDGSIQTFEAGDMRRPYPKAHASGSFNDTGVLNAVDSNNKAIKISGLDAGFVLSVGDYLSFTYGTNRALHQVMESATANGSGLTPYFEVRPHLRVGWTLSPAISVTLKKPMGVFMLVPGSVNPQMRSGLSGSVAFQAVQYLS
jgi:hypothetical protein